MQNLSWDVEDTFFGALLGAYLGTFADSLSVINVILLILFFILFPAVLRKYSSSDIVIALNLGIVFWIILFTFNLYKQGIIIPEKGYVLIIIFLGWLVSKNLNFANRHV